MERDGSKTVWRIWRTFGTGCRAGSLPPCHGCIPVYFAAIAISFINFTAKEQMVFPKLTAFPMIHSHPVKNPLHRYQQVFLSEGQAVFAFPWGDGKIPGKGFAPRRLQGTPAYRILKAAWKYSSGCGRKTCKSYSSCWRRCLSALRLGFICIR